MIDKGNASMTGDGDRAWVLDGADHPVYLPGDDLEAARDEWLKWERRVDASRLRLGAIASAVSRGREYGDKNLEKLAEMVDASYKAVHDHKQFYERIADLEISDRSEILRKLKNGQTNFTKLLVSAPIIDDATFMEVATRLGGDGKPVSATAVRREAKAIKVAQRVDHLQAVARANPLLPWYQPGCYKTLVVDPPWEMKMAWSGAQKHRSLAWPYPSMTEAELRDLKAMRELPDTQSHLYLWTTHKHLETALRLIDFWGYRYQCVLTWIKGGGMVQFSWCYDTELVLFANRGGLRLERMGMPLHFEERSREHSRKPNKLYDIVRQASPEPRIDVFSREERKGFDSWGDQQGYFFGQPRLPLADNEQLEKYKSSGDVHPRNLSA